MGNVPFWFPKKKKIEQQHQGGKKEAVSIVVGKVKTDILLLLFTIRSTKLQNLNLSIAWRSVAIHHDRCEAIPSS